MVWDKVYCKFAVFGALLGGFSVFNQPQRPLLYHFGLGLLNIRNVNVFFNEIRFANNSKIIFLTTGNSGNRARRQQGQISDCFGEMLG